ncbi:MAG: hypothetical protein R3D27_04510 [Hyphomicrobiaceae bacterium]
MRAGRRDLGLALRLARYGTKDERRARWVEVIRRLGHEGARILAPVDGKKFIATAKANLAKVEAE